MSRWVYVLLYLLFEGQAARRDARVRFLMAQIEILRSRLDGNRVILFPSERARLLAIGRELSHDVKGILGIVKPETYRRWLRQTEAGVDPKSIGRPRISAVRRRIILRLAKENIGWGHPHQLLRVIAKSLISQGGGDISPTAYTEKRGQVSLRIMVHSQRNLFRNHMLSPDHKFHQMNTDNC